MLIHAASAYLSYVLHIGSDQMISDKGENAYLDIVEGKAWRLIQEAYPTLLGIH